MADSTIIYSGTKVSQLSAYPGSVLNPDDLFLISKKDDDGKYTSYKIDYRNMLTAVATNSFLSNAYYDQSSKKLVLNFIINDNQLCSVSCTIGDMIQPYTAGSYIKIQNNKISALIQGGRLISVKKGANDDSCWINSTLSAGKYTNFSGDKVNANIIAGSGIWLSDANNSCQINVNYGNISSVLNLSSYGSKLSAGDYINIQNNRISALVKAGKGIKVSRTNSNECQIEADMSKISSDLKLSSYAKPLSAGDYINIQNNRISALVKAGKGIKVSKTSSNECQIENALSGGTYSEINNNRINVRMLAGSGIAINNISNQCKINAKYNEISSGIHLSNYALTSQLSTIQKLSAGNYINTNGDKINVQLSAGNGIKLSSTPANYCKIEADMSKISSDLKLSSYAKPYTAGSYIKIQNNKISALIQGGRLISVKKGANDDSCWINSTLSAGRYTDFSGDKVNANIIAGGGVWLSNVNNSCQINVNYGNISSVLNLSNLQNLSAGDYIKIQNNKISALVKAGKGIKVNRTSSNECQIENALSGGKFTNIQNNQINANISASSGIKIFEKDNTCYICADYNQISTDLHLSDYSKPYYPGRAIKIANNTVSNMVFAGKGLKEDNRYFGSTVSACYFDLDYSIISSELKLSSIQNLSAGKYIKINDNKIDSQLSAGNGIKLISTPENYCKIEADMSKISSVLNLSNLQNLSAGDYIKIQNNKISALIKAGNGITVNKTSNNECKIEADFSKLSSLLSVDYLLSSQLSSGTYTEVDNVNHRVNSLLTAGDCIVIKEDGNKFSINADCQKIASEINLSDYAHLSDLEHVDVLSSKGGRYTTVNLNGKTYTIDVNLSAVSADLNLSAYTTIVHEGSYISIDNKNNISALIKGSDNIKVSKDTDKFCKIEVDLPHLSSDLSLDIYATPYFAGTYISVDSSKNIVHNTLREGRGIKIKQGSGSQSGIYKITTDIEAITADIALSNYVLISTLHRLSAGLSCQPVGNYTWVEGFKTSAYGDFGHSEGLCTNAYGDGLRLNGAYMRSYLGNKLNFAHAEGSNTLAYSVGSHAEGEGTSACAAFSHTEGLKCTTLYLNEGGQKYVAEYSHTEGLETSCAGRFSHAEGDKNYVKGYGAHVEGVSSEVYGNYAHAEGRGNITHGDGSHVEGDYNTSNGDYSHVEGQRNIIFGKTNNTNGHYSHAEGQENKVYGSYSHAEGHYNSISADYSHAEGVSCVIPLSDDHTFCFNGNSNCSYKSNGPGTFNINVEDGLNNVYIGTSSLYELIVDVVKRYGPVTL